MWGDGGGNTLLRRTRARVGQLMAQTVEDNGGLTRTVWKCGARRGHSARPCQPIGRTVVIVTTTVAPSDAGTTWRMVSTTESGMTATSRSACSRTSDQPW